MGGRWARAGALVVAVAVLTVFSGLARAVPEGPPYPSPEWSQREAANFDKTNEERRREEADPSFRARLDEQSAANLASYQQRIADDPTWAVTSTNVPCGTWAGQCAGDPFLYPGVDPFYDNEGEVVPVLFYDRDGAGITGRVWAPKGSGAGANLPGVVIDTGSVGASEPLYWWFAQALVRSGYVVLTYDNRGQGRSDTTGKNGEPGTNLNSAVFWEGLATPSTSSTPLPRTPTRTTRPSSRVATRPHPPTPPTPSGTASTTTVWPSWATRWGPPG
jgi:hypothetical protein